MSRGESPAQVRSRGVNRRRAGPDAAPCGPRPHTLTSCRTTSSSPTTPRTARDCPTCCASPSGRTASCSRRKRRGRAPARSTATAPPDGPPSPTCRGRAHPILHPARRQHRPRPRPGKGVPLAVRPDPRPRPRGGLLADRAHRQAGPPRGEPPHARGSGIPTLEIVVDSHERYAWTFDHQQVTTRRDGLPGGTTRSRSPAGVLASVERKSLVDLVSTLTTGKMRYLLADLSSLPTRPSSSRTDTPPSSSSTASAPPSRRRARRVPGPLPHRPDHLLRDPALAQEWTYRFLSAALAHADEETHVETEATPLTPRAPPARRGAPVGTQARVRRVRPRAHPTRDPRGIRGTAVEQRRGLPSVDIPRYSSLVRRRNP